MKIFLLLFALLAVSAHAAESQTPPAPPPRLGYAEFIQQLVLRENLSDCIAQMDQLVDAGEKAAFSEETGSVWAEVATKSGLQLRFRISDLEEAIVYYVVISRGGEELKYSDAAKIAALFADRAGLPHPVNLTEGEKPVFYGQWLIKPSQWKALRKKMLEVRTQNRDEKDPARAFILAIDREMTAREATLRAR